MVNKDFVLAGDAIFTIETSEGYRAAEKASGREPRTHYTWWVQVTEPTAQYPNPAHFAKYFTGTENTNYKHYTYLGKLDDFTGQVNPTAGSRGKVEASVPFQTALKLLNRVLARVWSGDGAAIEAAGFKVHHEGMCACCRKKLTTPESIERGVGPTCAKRMLVGAA